MKDKRRPSDVAYMVDRECRVEKDPGAMLEILLSYSDSRRTELRPVNVLLSMQVIWLLRSILKKTKQINTETQKTSTFGEETLKENLSV